MDFETVLEKCGNFGRYQVLLLMVFGYTNIMSSMHYFSNTLISFTPDHWCHHPKLENQTFQDIKEIYKDYNNPKCTLLEHRTIDNMTEFYESDVATCNKWLYNREGGYESITTELNWVCDRAYLSAVGQSFYYIGAVLGTIFYGMLADHIGRLPAVIISTLTGGIGDFLSSFVGSVTTFAISRFVSGLSTDTFFMLMYILTFEYLAPKKRTFGSNICTLTFYCFGLVVSPYLALWVQSWRKYLLIASIPVTLVAGYPLLICESAQWLLTRKRYERAVKCLKRIAKFNGRKVEEGIYEEFIEHYKKKMDEEDKKERSDTFWGMFRTPRLRKFTIILLVKSMIVTLSYDVISRNMEGLGSSPFKLFSLTALCYIPGGLTIIAFQNIVGRKGMATLSMFVGAIITAATGFLIAYLDVESSSTLLALMVGLGRYGAIVAYDAEVQYCTEIIPTSVRGRGVANIHVVGYAFSFLTSYIIYLGTFYKPLPSILISSIMFIGAGLCLYLPETMHKKLPETLSDGEAFALNEKWYYFPCMSRRNEKSNDAEQVPNGGEINLSFSS